MRVEGTDEVGESGMAIEVKALNHSQTNEMVVL